MALQNVLTEVGNGELQGSDYY